MLVSRFFILPCSSWKKMNQTGRHSILIITCNQLERCSPASLMSPPYPFRNCCTKNSRTWWWWWDGGHRPAIHTRASKQHVWDKGEERTNKQARTSVSHACIPKPAIPCHSHYIYILNHTCTSCVIHVIDPTGGLDTLLLTSCRHPIYVKESVRSSYILANGSDQPHKKSRQPSSSIGVTKFWCIYTKTNIASPRSEIARVSSQAAAAAAAAYA